jgi:hypothetical protein
VSAVKDTTVAPLADISHSEMQLVYHMSSLAAAAAAECLRMLVMHIVHCMRSLHPVCCLLVDGNHVSVYLASIEV